jgi:hypothetical protein
LLHRACKILSIGRRSVGASNENCEKKTGDLVRPQIFLNAAVPLLSRDVVCRQGETQKVGPRSFAKCGNGFICYLFILDEFIFQIDAKHLNTFFK